MTIPATDSPRGVGALPLDAPAGAIAGDRLRQQIVVVASMYIGYALFMVLRMIPSVAAPAMMDDPSLELDLEVWGKILAIGNCGAVLGKIICGYSADKFGGKLTFAVGLLMASLFLGLFGSVSAVWLLGAMYFLALMAKSAGWPSMARIIINWFKPDQYGRVWGILSTSSRIGTLAATFGLASLLVWMSWREMIWIAAGLGFAAAIVFAFLLKEHPAGTPTSADHTVRVAPQAPHPLDGTTLLEAIPRILSSARFWLIAGSLMGLGILWDFLLMVPLFLQKTLHLAEAQAGQAASAFPFGSLISVLIGGYVFDKLSRGTTAWVMGLLLTIATGCLAAFLMVPQFELTAGPLLWISLGLLFVFGLCVSPCYYIPMSVFSIEFGGPHSGFLIALLDALSFVATAIFYYFGGSLAKQSWDLFLTVLLAISVWSALATIIFLRGEARHQRQAAAA